MVNIDPAYCGGFEGVAGFTGALLALARGVESLFWLDRTVFLLARLGLKSRS